MKGKKQALEWQICIKVLSATHYLLVSPSHMAGGLPNLAPVSQMSISSDLPSYTLLHTWVP